MGLCYCRAAVVVGNVGVPSTLAGQSPVSVVLLLLFGLGTGLKHTPLQSRVYSYSPSDLVFEGGN